MEFIEKSYTFVLDSDISSGENEDGEYFVNFDGKKVGSSAILTNMLQASALQRPSG